MPPKLSIITPSFNQGAFLERTIRSVLDQGYPNLEYVIVDGGSSDESVEIIKRYEDRLAWWVSEPDEGQTHAINKGIERTSGEIVAYINSDDYYMPGAFEAAVNALERSDRTWVSAAVEDIEEGDPPIPLGIWRPTEPSQSEGPLRGRQWWMLAPWCVPQPSTFWRRELFDEFGLFRPEMHFAFDAELMLRLAYAGEMPELLAERILAVRSVHPEQKSSDMRRWWPEVRGFVEIFSPQLSEREKRRLAAIRWPVIAYLNLRHRLLQPALRFAGDLLEHVPQRLRPPIRHRDRSSRRARAEHSQPGS